MRLRRSTTTLPTDPAQALALAQHEAPPAQERRSAREVVLPRSLSQQLSLQHESTETWEEDLTLATLQQLSAHESTETRLLVRLWRLGVREDAHSLLKVGGVGRAVQHD